MKALVIGYGSIGHRHVRLLKDMAEVAVVSSRDVSEHRRYATPKEALRDYHPDYIVIATITSRHGESLDTLKTLDYTGRVLVEKPLFVHAGQNAAPYPFTAYVAYHLRFHPVIVALKQALVGHMPLTAHIYVGQHLLQWRPSREIKDSYSAHREQGGGVLRDLSHELDLAQYFFGPIGESHAVGGRVSDLTVDSEDAVAFALRCAQCPVISLQMNYLDHAPRREWIVNCREASLKADVIKGSLTINQEKPVPISFEIDDAYRAMHRAALAEGEGLCSFEEGLALTRFIDKVALS